MINIFIPWYTFLISIIGFVISLNISYKTHNHLIKKIAHIAGAIIFISLLLIFFQVLRSERPRRQLVGGMSPFVTLLCRGTQTFDYSEPEKIFENPYEIIHLFGSLTIDIHPNIPLKIEVRSFFSTIKILDTESTSGIGKQTYFTHLDKDPLQTIKVVSYLGSVTIKNKPA